MSTGEQPRSTFWQERREQEEELFRLLEREIKQQEEELEIIGFREPVEHRRILEDLRANLRLAAITKISIDLCTKFDGTGVSHL